MTNQSVSCSLKMLYFSCASNFGLFFFPFWCKQLLNKSQNIAYLCSLILISLSVNFTQVTALIAGLIYLQIPYDQDGIQNIAGVYFFLVTSTSFSNLQGVLFVSISTLKYRTDVSLLFLPSNLISKHSCKKNGRNDPRNLPFTPDDQKAYSPFWSLHFP